MVGRFHYYEGHALSKVIFPIRVMASLGIKVLIGNLLARHFTYNKLQMLPVVLILIIMLVMSW